METTKIRLPNNLTRYEAMLMPKWRAGSVMRLVGLISKKEANKMLVATKKARNEWR